MNPGRYNGFNFTQGDTFTSAPAWKISGSYVNVSGYSALMQLRRGTNTGTVVLELSTANGRIVAGSTDGKFTITVSSAVTATVPAGSFYYDLQVTSPDNVTTTILSGVFTVNAQVSA
jgi:hypothetical protein